MKKILTVLTILILSQFLTFKVFAGSDGTVDIKSKNKAVEHATEVKDCFETVNRGIFAFNQGLDKIFFKPVAKGYRYLPKPIRSGTSNALNNLSNVVTIPNNVLQGQFKEAGINTLRFSINTTLGIAGIFDVALLLTDDNDLGNDEDDNINNDNNKNDTNGGIDERINVENIPMIIESLKNTDQIPTRKLIRLKKNGFYLNMKKYLVLILQKN